VGSPYQGGSELGTAKLKRPERKILGTQENGPGGLVHLKRKRDGTQDVGEEDRNKGRATHGREVPRLRAGPHSTQGKIKEKVNKRKVVTATCSFSTWSQQDTNSGRRVSDFLRQSGGFSQEIQEKTPKK